MIRSIEDIEQELKKMLEERKPPSEPTPKKESQIVLKALKDVKRDGELFEKKDVKLLSKKVKQVLNDEQLLEHIQDGLKPVRIAEKHGVSRSAISQRISKLESQGFIERRGRKLKVKEIVKDLKLSTLPSRKQYQFQTIQITIPIKNPEILDIVKWDEIKPKINMKIKRIGRLKVTIVKMGKHKPSIILYLHSRWIEKPEQIKEICKNYVNLVAKQLKEYDIEVDVDSYRTSGLHLWKKDEIVEEEYEKDMGVIGVYHGVEADKIGPEDEVTERKTWIESTPTPDGIETNDPLFFLDKRRLEEYMKVPTLFISTLKDGIKSQGIYNTNLIKHIDLVDTIKDQSINQTEIMKDVKEMVKEVTSISKSLRTELKVLRVESTEDKPPEKYEEVSCPFCKSTFAKKLLKEKSHLCPGCYRNLKLYFPDI